jgi:hypothetical protein
VSGTNGGAATQQTMTVRDLPLILIDSRGSMALALYGNSAHTVMCTIDPQGGASVTPDIGPWPKPTGTELVSPNAGAVMGTMTIGADNSTLKPSGTTRLLGTVSSLVTAMTVDVPGVGTVTATIKDGYYSIFIPNTLVGSSGSSTGSSWTAHLTLADGTTHNVPLPGQMVTSGSLQQPAN